MNNVLHSSCLPKQCLKGVLPIPEASAKSTSIPEALHQHSHHLCYGSNATWSLTVAFWFFVFCFLRAQLIFLYFFCLLIHYQAFLITCCQLENQATQHVCGEGFRAKGWVLLTDWGVGGWGEWWEQGWVGVCAPGRWSRKSQGSSEQRLWCEKREQASRRCCLTPELRVSPRDSKQWQAS